MNRFQATVRLGFDAWESGAHWCSESREFETGHASEPTREDALRESLVFALRLLADSLEDGRAPSNRRGEPVLEWSDQESIQGKVEP